MGKEYARSKDGYKCIKGIKEWKNMGKGHV
jgi:hypothetical protein